MSSRRGVRYLLDTNVWSELSKSTPNTAVEEWLEGLDAWRVSATTLLEVEDGIRKVSPERSRVLRAWLDETRKRTHVLPFDAGAALSAAVFLEEMRNHKPHLNMEWRDLTIAATAQNFGLVLATRNVKHFEHLRIPLFNPFPG